MNERAILLLLMPDVIYVHMYVKELLTSTHGRCACSFTLPIE